MGLRANALALLLPHLPAKRVLSLSYPDLVMSQEQLEDMTGFRAEVVRSGKWHQVPHDLPETLEVFRRLGTEEFRAVDIVASRGCEEIIDLNYPQDLGQWDLVIDPGTTEHCFNIGQALMNAANAVAPGGLILHTPPLSMMNHGFYCLMPTLFHDFYGQNEWECLTLKATNGTTLMDCPPIKRFHASPELSMLCLYRRTNGNALRFPTQTKYLLHPTLN